MANLDDGNYFVVNVKGDGNCAFRAVAKGVLDLRALGKLVHSDFIRKNEAQLMSGLRAKACQLAEQEDNFKADFKTHLIPLFHNLASGEDIAAEYSALFGQQFNFIQNKLIELVELINLDEFKEALDAQKAFSEKNISPLQATIDKISKENGNDARLPGLLQQRTALQTEFENMVEKFYTPFLTWWDQEGFPAYMLEMKQDGTFGDTALLTLLAKHYGFGLNVIANAKAVEGQIQKRGNTYYSGL